MKDQGYGRLLFTSSSAALFGNAGQASYAAAKARVFGLAQALAIEGKPHGILANVLLPMADTPRATAGMTAQTTAAAGVEAQRTVDDTKLVSALVAYVVSQENTPTHEAFASAGGRYYSAFDGTTPGCQHAGGPQRPAAGAFPCRSGTRDTSMRCCVRTPTRWRLCSPSNSPIIGRPVTA